MNVTSSRDDEIAHYIASVENSLYDLPPHVRGELIGDLVDHLTEIAGEITMAVPLAARLGPPERYAAELRSTLPASADTPRIDLGRPPDTTHVPGLDWDRIAARIDGALGRLTGYAGLGDLRQALKPGWWALRGALAIHYALGILVFATGDGYAESYSSVVLIPMALLYLVGAVVSIRLGRVTGPAGYWSNVTATVLVTAVVLYFTMVLLASSSYFYL